jgi:curved DNA-binding protein CbpA
MKTLYDLLGIRPSDNAETLRAAFRKAAKANHPDLHAGDPYAAMRFRQIARAYEILRDAERRAAYDRLLQFERERAGWRLKSTVSYLMRSVVSDAVAAIGLAIVLAGGYTVYAHISKTPAEELAGGRGSARIAVVQPAGPATTNIDERRDGPERNADPDMILPEAVASAPTHGLASEPTPGGSTPGAAVLNAEVANTANAMDRAGPKSAGERPGQTDATEKLDQDNAQLVKLSSSGETDDGARQSISPDFAMSGDKRDKKRSEAHDLNASDVKISDTKLPETKIPPRARIAAKRQAAAHTTFEQVSLENKNACSGSCPRDVPPLFGVGF